ncbi:MAG TPA: hypothetical protein HPP94_00970 [Desulfuromonadales bacterium]|nr:hypothetical protein [Desulfuromonadales bacterium]
MKNILVLLILIVLPSVCAGAESSCVDASGEAALINNDLPSAKVEAIARAKWTAVEQVAGVQIKAQSIVQNMQMIDDAISKNVSGVVTKYNLLTVNSTPDAVTVTVNVCVSPAKARDALSGLALNSSIAVFIPAQRPKVVRATDSRSGTHEYHSQTSVDEHEESNILSETIIGKLTEQGYTVVDVAPTNVLDAAEIEKAMKNGNFLSLRSLMYKFLSNVILIGKVDYTVSTRKGENIGYGVAMPFNSATVRLTYRLITRDASGKMIILTAGAESGKGLAGSVDDAVAAGLKELADKMSPLILDKVAKYIQGVTKKIDVKVSGVKDVGENFSIKEALQNITWVTAVEDAGIGSFTVSYPENSIYLANSIEQKGTFKITKFSGYTIELTYRR